MICRDLFSIHYSTYISHVNDLKNLLNWCGEIRCRFLSGVKSVKV